MARNFVTDELQNAMRIQQAEHLKAACVQRTFICGLLSLPFWYFWTTTDTTKSYDESSVLHYGKYVNIFFLVYFTIMAISNAWNALDAVVTLRRLTRSASVCRSPSADTSRVSPASIRQRVTFESSPSLLDESGFGKQSRKWPYESSPTALAVWHPRPSGAGDMETSNGSADMSWRANDVPLELNRSGRGNQSPMRENAPDSSIRGAFESPSLGQSRAAETYLQHRQAAQGLMSDGSAFRFATHTSASFAKLDSSACNLSGTAYVLSTTTVKQMIVSTCDESPTQKSLWGAALSGSRLAERSLVSVSRTSESERSSGRELDEGESRVSHLETLFSSSASETRWLRAIGRLREWLARTIVQRVAERLDYLRTMLESCGFPDDTLATCSIAQLSKLRDSHANAELARTLRELLPFLELELTETHDEAACGCVLCAPGARSPAPASRTLNEEPRRALALVGTSQYIVRRIASLAQSNSLLDYRAEAGSEQLGWPPRSLPSPPKPAAERRCAAVRTLPTDAHLLMHLLCTYLDCVLPQRADARRPFSDVYVHVVTVGAGCRDAACCSYESRVRSPDSRDPSDAPRSRRRRCASSGAVRDTVGVRILCEHRIEPLTGERRMQCDLLVRTDQAACTRVPIASGRNNAFLCILAFFYYLKHYEAGRLGGQLSLAASGLNVARVFDE